MENFSSEEIKSIDQAIKALERASLENKKRLKEMAGEDYRTIRKTVEDIAPEVERLSKELKTKSQEAISEAKEKTVDSASRVARAADRKAHEKPWQLAAGALLLGGFLGFSLRGSSSSENLESGKNYH